MDLFRNGTDTTGTGQIPFTRRILSEPFVFLSGPFQFFRSCKRALSWPNFSQIGSRVADLEFKTYPPLALIFISRKQWKTIFGGVLPVMRFKQIITPKLSMLMHTSEGTTIMTQQEKLKTKPDNRFISKALLCSILSVVEKASLVICNGQFSFSQRTTQVELSPPLLDTIFKSSTLPWKNRRQTASWSFS